MDIYLPIAEMPLNIFSLLLLGTAAGVLAGMFGIGGGFLMTPFLIFMGVPPAIAVSSSANQIIASSVSGFLAHWRRQNVDVKMGTVMLLGGMAGSVLGVQLFAYLKHIGLIDLVISLTYVFFLGTIGSLMGVESGRTLWRKRQGLPPPPRSRKVSWLVRVKAKLPWKMRFPRSKIRVSIVIPLLVGAFAGVLVSIMGIGGGFVLIPAMIYLIGMPTGIVIGTSLFQIIFVTSSVTILQSITTQTVDVVLALLLLAGSVIGAQLGTRYGARLPAEQLRMMLSLMVIGVALRLAFGLFVTPGSMYSITVMDR